MSKAEKEERAGPRWMDEWMGGRIRIEKCKFGYQNTDRFDLVLLRYTSGDEGDVKREGG